MDDLISRQAAIEAIDRLDIPEDMCVFEILSHIELEIGNLPSAQPEITRCKDCEHWTNDNCPFADNRNGYGCDQFDISDPEWYCADGVKRVDEKRV